MGCDHVYPKRIRLVVDVSGSMYRFNGHDGRLERSLEAVLMVMEAFDKQPNFKVELGFGDWLILFSMVVCTTTVTKLCTITVFLTLLLW